MCRQVGDGGGAAELLGQLVAAGVDLQPQLLQPARYPHAPALVAEVPLQLAEDGRQRVRAEVGRQVRVEPVHGLEQAHGRDLGQVGLRLAQRGEPAGQPLDVRQAALHRLLAQPGAGRIVGRQPCHLPQQLGDLRAPGVRPPGRGGGGVVVRAEMLGRAGDLQGFQHQPAGARDAQPAVPRGQFVADPDEHGDRARVEQPDGRHVHLDVAGAVGADLLGQHVLQPCAGGQVHDAEQAYHPGGAERCDADMCLVQRAPPRGRWSSCLHIPTGRNSDRIACRGGSGAGTATVPA